MIVSHPTLVIAAPASGSGKTTVTLGMIRAFRDLNFSVTSAKVGPDYIDAGFHKIASHRSCINLDSWSMRETLIDGLLIQGMRSSDLFIIEGVMGLFDGAMKSGSFGNGSTASIAKKIQAPVILIIDARSQAQSVAALAKGFRDHDAGLNFAGVILNRVSSERHAKLLTNSLESAGLTVFGVIPHLKELELGSRHLGLVQAQEHRNIEKYIKQAAKIMSDCLNLNDIHRIATSAKLKKQPLVSGLKPLGQRISIAKDAAFSFIYPHVISSWRENGAEIFYFSPLQDERPALHSDAIYLPGGYPELYAGKLASNQNFLASLHEASINNVFIFGECGGYITLGDILIDKSGTRHKMAGLLPIETTFEQRKLSLGYRKAITLDKTPFGPAGKTFRCHEFHYASVLTNTGNKLFKVEDGNATDLGLEGSQKNTVFGSFMHMIDYV